MSKLIWSTPEAENIISYCARVSSPKNQEKFDTAPKLLKYCIENGHWSIFEMAGMCVEIETSRAIAQQILRHRSFSFQEFSQRYADVNIIGSIVNYDARRQDVKNRQNSIDDLPSETKEWFASKTTQLSDLAFKAYNEALDKGIAKECARFLLPLSTTTKLYMNGTVRSWIHYLQLRTGNGTQKEHADIAKEVRDSIFIPAFPNISEALGWK
jgi:thymidylate synthase (FAD)